MATANDSGEDGDFQAASMEDYEEAVRDTKDVPFTAIDGGMEVQTLQPLEVVKQLQKFGVQSLLKGDGMSEEEVVGDGESTGIGPFMDQCVAPRVTSHVAYWDEDDVDVDDRPADEDAPRFDLSILDPDDIKGLVRGMMGQDVDADAGDSGNSSAT